MSEKEKDLVDLIISYEQGDLSPRKTLELFSALVKSGQAWTLQGHYGRNAELFIKEGLLERNGNIVEDEAELVFARLDNGGN